MYSLIIVFHVVACFILIAAILLQSGRGSGLSGLFGGGSSQTIFGARASTFLTRTTTAAAIVFLLTCISLTIFSSRRVKSLMTGVEETEVLEESLAETKAEEAAEETVEWMAEEAKPAASEAQQLIPQEPIPQEQE